MKLNMRIEIMVCLVYNFLNIFSYIKYDETQKTKDKSSNKTLKLHTLYRYSKLNFFYSLWPMGFRWSYVAPSLPARLHVCSCSCRWGRSEHTLQSGQQMSQQNSKRLGDA